MKLVKSSAVVGLAAALVVLAGCAGDDGATTRQAGTVAIIGPPPPGGGGSVSAIGGGCTTKGASTKRIAYNVIVNLDEYTVTVPATVPAGVTRIVVKNFGAEPHEIVVTQAASVDALPRAGTGVDLEALPNKVHRVMEFPANTICEGIFDLPAGNYVVFSNLERNGTNDFDQGMAATFVVS